VQSLPAQAEPLLRRVLAHLAERLEVPESDIELVRVQTAVWTTLDLNCGDPNLPAIANLEIDGFRFTLRVAGQVYEYHTDLRSAVHACEGGGRSLALLLETDPVAADMVALAQRRLAERLQLAVRRIRVVDIAPYTWVDSSLGCPQPNVAYPPIVIEGYRIVLSAGDQEYIFHTDSTQLIPCEPANERLPT
jgi:hypothetical protein